jgi:hypothetical protein
MDAPVCVIVGISAVTFVPYGTVTAIVLEPITPVAAGYEGERRDVFLSDVAHFNRADVAVACGGASC